MGPEAVAGPPYLPHTPHGTRRLRPSKKPSFVWAANVLQRVIRQRMRKQYRASHRALVTKQKGNVPAWAEAQGDEEEVVEKPVAPPPSGIIGRIASWLNPETWLLMRLLLPALMVEYAWTIGELIMMPYLTDLGVPVSVANLLWLVNPLCGLIVQPLVGQATDTCKSRWGRRRPFMIGLLSLTALGYLLIAWAPALTMSTQRWNTALRLIERSGGAVIEGVGEEEASPMLVPWAFVVLTFAGYGLVDLCVDCLLIPSRALITDKLPPRRAAYANTIFGAVGSLGRFLALGLTATRMSSLPRWLTAVFWTRGGRVRESSAISVRVLFGALSVAVTVAVAGLVGTVHETPIEPRKDSRVEDGAPAAASTLALEDRSAAVPALECGAASQPPDASSSAAGAAVSAASSVWSKLAAATSTVTNHARALWGGDRATVGERAPLLGMRSAAAGEVRPGRDIELGLGLDRHGNGVGLSDSDVHRRARAPSEGSVVDEEDEDEDEDEEEEEDGVVDDYFEGEEVESEEDEDGLETDIGDAEEEEEEEEEEVEDVTTMGDAASEAEGPDGARHMRTGPTPALSRAASTMPLSLPRGPRLDLHPARATTRTLATVAGPAPADGGTLIHGSPLSSTTQARARRDKPRARVRTPPSLLRRLWRSVAAELAQALATVRKLPSLLQRLWLMACALWLSQLLLSMWLTAFLAKDVLGLGQDLWPARTYASEDAGDLTFADITWMAAPGLSLPHAPSTQLGVQLGTVAMALSGLVLLLYGGLALPKLNGMFGPRTVFHATGAWFLAWLLVLVGTDFGLTPLGALVCVACLAVAYPTLQTNTLLIADTYYSPDYYAVLAYLEHKKLDLLLPWTYEQLRRARLAQLTAPGTTDQTPTSIWSQLRAAYQDRCRGDDADDAPQPPMLFGDTRARPFVRRASATGFMPLPSGPTAVDAADALQDVARENAALTREALESVLAHVHPDARALIRSTVTAQENEELTRSALLLQQQRERLAVRARKHALLHNRGRTRLQNEFWAHSRAASRAPSHSRGHSHRHASHSRTPATTAQSSPHVSSLPGLTLDDRHGPSALPVLPSPARMTSPQYLPTSTAATASSRAAPAASEAPLSELPLFPVVDYALRLPSPPHALSSPTALSSLSTSPDASDVLLGLGTPTDLHAPMLLPSALPGFPSEDDPALLAALMDGAPLPASSRGTPLRGPASPFLPTRASPLWTLPLDREHDVQLAPLEEVPLQIPPAMEDSTLAVAAETERRETDVLTDMDALQDLSDALYGKTLYEDGFVGPETRVFGVLSQPPSPAAGPQDVGEIVARMREDQVDRDAEAAGAQSVAVMRADTPDVSPASPASPLAPLPLHRALTDNLLGGGSMAALHVLAAGPTEPYHEAFIAHPHAGGRVHVGAARAAPLLRSSASAVPPVLEEAGEESEEDAGYLRVPASGDHRLTSSFVSPPMSTATPSASAAPSAASTAAPLIAPAPHTRKHGPRALSLLASEPASPASRASSFSQPTVAATAATAATTTHFAPARPDADQPSTAAAMPAAWPSFAELLGLDLALPPPPVDEWGQHILLGIALPELPEHRLPRDELLPTIPEHSAHSMSAHLSANLSVNTATADAVSPVITSAAPPAHQPNATAGVGATVGDAVVDMSNVVSPRAALSDSEAEALDTDTHAHARERWTRSRRLRSLSTSSSDAETPAGAGSVMQFGQDRAPWLAPYVDAYARGMSKAELARMMRARMHRPAKRPVPARAHALASPPPSSELARVSLPPAPAAVEEEYAAAGLVSRAQDAAGTVAAGPVGKASTSKSWQLPRAQERQLESKLEVLVHREEEIGDTASFGQIAAVMGTAMTVAQVLMGLFAGLLIEATGSIRGVFAVSAAIVALIQGATLVIDLRYWDRDENVARGVAARRRERRLRAQAAKHGARAAAHGS